LGARFAALARAELFGELDDAVDHVVERARVHRVDLDAERARRREVAGRDGADVARSWVTTRSGCSSAISAASTA
jgi:hypothetical protein